MSDPTDAMTAIPDKREPIEHELKTWQSYFHAIKSGEKLFEIRRDDRDFRVGDTLRLRETEYGSGAYTGREARRTITYILRLEEDLGLMAGFAVLSLAPVTIDPTDAEVERIAIEAGCSRSQVRAVLAALPSCAEASADDIRAMGWSVAVHNDYRQGGVAHTFWLFTKDGRAVKGEGRTDAEALNQVLALIPQEPQS